MRHIFPAYPEVLAIDATVAGRHFAALLLDWPDGILTCLTRVKTNEIRAVNGNGSARTMRVGKGRIGQDED